MKYVMKRNVLIVVLVISILLTMVFISYAAEGTKTESESNDSLATADQTYDDYDNRGTLSSYNDSDFWKITFPQAGQANFWLGNIANGKDYDLFLYDSNGYFLDCSYDRGDSTTEMIKYDVNAGDTFYIEICSLAGDYSSTQYLFRAKWYAAPKFHLFTFSYVDSGGVSYDSSPTATYSIPHLWKMGYTGQEYENNSASSAYSAFKNSAIFVVRNHGSAGRISFVNASGTKTYLKGTSSSSTDTAIMNYNNGELNENLLAIFSGCYTGKNSSTYGNLVNAALAKGSKCAIGWKEKSYTEPANSWVGEFFNWCSQGAKISEAMNKADAYVKREHCNNVENYIYTDMRNRETGTSNLAEIIG